MQNSESKIWEKRLTAETQSSQRSTLRRKTGRENQDILFVDSDTMVGFPAKYGICLVLLLFVLAATPTRSLAQEHDVLELYRLAKAKDPILVAAESRLEAGRADKEIAWAALLPRISANSSIKRFWPTVHNYGSTTIEGNYTGYSYGAGATLNVLNIPAYYQISAATAGIESADFALDATRQTLIIRLIDAYLRYLKAQSDEKLYREELSRMGKVLEQAQAFCDSGTGDIIAVFEAKARMDSAAADLVKVEGQRTLAKQELASLAGVPIDGIKEIEVEKPKGTELATLEWWLDMMQKNSPAIHQASRDLDKSKATKLAVMAGHYPTIQGSGGFTVDKGSTFLPEVETAQWYSTIGINIPLYSGGETTARTRSARAAETERRAMLDDAREQGIKKLKEAYLNLLYNQSLAEAYQRKFESAELQLKAVQKGSSIGTRTAIDLLNAEQSYAISRRDLTAALYDNIKRRMELKAAAGILTESDLAELN